MEIWRYGEMEQLAKHPNEVACAADGRKNAYTAFLALKNGKVYVSSTGDTAGRIERDGLDSVQDGDEVSLTLDRTKLQLSWAVNGRHVHTLGGLPNSEFRLFVTMSDNIGASCEAV